MKGTNPIYIEQPFKGDDKVYYVNGGRCSGKVDKTINELVNYTNKIQQENKKLKKQLEEYQLQNIDLRADIMIQKMAFPNKAIKDKTFYELYDMPNYEDLLNQQKEFIEYLENMLDNENDIFSVVRVKDVLSKYKEIIGGKDER